MKRLVQNPVMIIMSGLTLLPASNVIAQSNSGTLHSSTSNREINFTVNGGFDYQLKADTDSEGDFSLTRFNTDLKLKADFSSELHCSFQVGYSLDSYDFGGLPLGAGGGAEPWQDIHTLWTAATLTWDLNREWSVFGGPVFQSSREESADWGDSLIGGGSFGATYKFSDDLIVGGGLLVVSQIEADVRIVPIIIINWQIGPDLRVSNRTTAGSNGLELVYSVGHSWEFAIGAASQFSRFRLDGDGVGPDGVGQDESTPIWLRASYELNNNLRIDTVGGVNFGGELRLDDNNGDNIAHADYDAAFFLGVNVRIRF